MRKIQILRGTFAKKPNLEDGQMYLAKDTKQVFVGDKAIAEGEIEFANKSDLTTFSSKITNIEVSETQPTNQKAGDFWYYVTGTV